MTLPASGQKWLDTLETMRAAIAELAAERDEHRDRSDRYGSRIDELLKERTKAEVERDAAVAKCAELERELAAAKGKLAALQSIAADTVSAISEVVPDEPLDELTPIFQLETKRHHWEYVVDCRDRLAIAAAEQGGA